MGGQTNNSHLPSKACQQCGRPFSWRKKWERDWDRVLYCSKACTAAAKRERKAGERDQGSSSESR
ncbi:DUF2256 domain-containing protein [Mucisphaera sp.]|uniref:DUF2256 domain-containing protein n=1 Tax=Mucisphaera sp. TaxID=2913024 RepID=UPI003D0BF161